MLEKIPSAIQAKIPTYVKTMLQLLQRSGYQAYVVGGAVRDLLLGLEPGDFDITTNALPEQVLAVARQAQLGTVASLGHNLGVVIVVVEGRQLEVATFRGERYGVDAHRPEAVWFCEHLRDDLSRRDFTVNAMALDLEGQLYDYFGGRQDLRARVLRTVGNPIIRYGEDALRMYRACRFVAQLDFTYCEPAAAVLEAASAKGGFGQPGTPYYLPARPHFTLAKCRNLSLERVRTELEKLLVAQAAGRGLMLLVASGLAATSCKVREQGQVHQVPVLPELVHLVGMPQNPKYHRYDVWEHVLTAVDAVPRDLTLRWAALLHDVAKGLPGIRQPNKEGQPSDYGHEQQGAVLAREILTRLGYAPAFVQRVSWLVAQHMRFAPMLMAGTRASLHWLRTEARSGSFRSAAEMTAAYTQLREVYLADMQATRSGLQDSRQVLTAKLLSAKLVQLAAVRMPVRTGDLRLSGRDVLTMLQGDDTITVKDALSYLLQRVQGGSLPNEAAALRQALQVKLQKSRCQQLEAADTAAGSNPEKDEKLL